MFRPATLSMTRAAARSTLKQPASVANAVRCARFSSSSPKADHAASSSSNTGLLLALGGLAGIGAWYSMGGFNGDIRSKLEQISADGGDVALSGEEFRALKLKEVRPYNHDSSFYVFELPDNKKSGMFTASALVIRGAGDEPKGKDGKPVIRPYTPVNDPSDKGELVLLIKHYPDGAMTQYLKGIKPGEEMRFKGPIPKHRYSANQFEEIGLVAAGSGITPMWQLIQQILSDPKDKTKVTLLYGNKSAEDILLKERFDEFAKDPRFNVVYFLDKQSKDVPSEKGYVTKDHIQKYFPGSDKGDKAKIFVCGPPPMVSALAGPKQGFQQGELKGILAELGYTAEQVFKF